MRKSAGLMFIFIFLTASCTVLPKASSDERIENSWTTKSSMPQAISGVKAAVVNGKIYVVGGITYEDEDNQRQKYTAANEVYDPAKDSWTIRQSSPIAGARHPPTVVDHKICIMGGTDSSQQWKSNQIYEVENDSWSLGASLPTNTYYAAAVATTVILAPETIYVFGGGLTEPTGSVHVYDPVLDNWTFGTSMPTNRTSLAVGIVNDVIYGMGGNLGWEGGEWPLYGHPLGTTNVVEQYTPFGYGTILPEFEPFPIMLVAATIATVTSISIGLLVYLKNRYGGRNKRN